MGGYNFILRSIGVLNFLKIASDALVPIVQYVDLFSGNEYMALEKLQQHTALFPVGANEVEDVLSSP